VERGRPGAVAAHQRLHQAYLARLAGLTLAELKHTVRVSFTKVAEYQLRGLVHFHAVVRLDATPPDDQPDAIFPPPQGFTVDLLTAAIRLAAHAGIINGQLVPAASAPVPAFGSHGPRRAVWGKELDLRPIRRPGPGATTAEQVAGYIAKYATKGTESFGPALDRRIYNFRQLDRAERVLTPHIAAMLRTCWTLGADPALASLRLRPWAHMLGFGATGRPRAAATPPPWAPYAGPGPPGLPATTPSASTRTRTPPRPSWSCASGPTGATAGRPPARPPSPTPSPLTPASSAAPLGLPAPPPEPPAL
jgi:hypothetical protein